jgi:hypothetical protein
MAVKVDDKREFRQLYAPGLEPAFVDVPEMTFLTIDGTGDPNTSLAFQAAVEALYAASYGLKFAIKRAPSGIDHVVMPLEGLWHVPGQTGYPEGAPDAWSWTLMIKQPDEVTQELAEEAIHDAAVRKPLPAATQLRLERFHEGRSAQVMYVGPFAAERPTIERLMAFIRDQGHEPEGRHHEIYLSDPARTAPEKLKTIIRHPVR